MGDEGEHRASGWICNSKMSERSTKLSSAWLGFLLQRDGLMMGVPLKSAILQDSHDKPDWLRFSV